MKESFRNFFTDREILDIFDYLDVSFERFISIGSIMLAFRRPIGDKCRHLLTLVYDRLDQNGSGVVAAHDVAAGYDPSRHPDVVAGKKTAEEEYRDFLDSFEVGGEVEGCVTRGEFMEYFSNVAASLEDDDLLCRIVGNTWLDPLDYESFEENYAKRLNIKERSFEPTVTNSFVSREPYNIISFEENTKTAKPTRLPLGKENSTIFSPNGLSLPNVEGGVRYLLKKANAALLTYGKAGILSFEKRLRYLIGISSDDMIVLGMLMQTKIGRLP